MSADTDLISRAAGGDVSAFQALVEQHRSMVYRVAYQFAGNHYDAEDIAQDVFIKVYRSLDRFRRDAQLTSWMYRIVMNACIDHRRRHRPGVAVPFGEEAEQRVQRNVPMLESSGRRSRGKSAGSPPDSGLSSSCGIIKA
jgi:RNA polymerase sigma-70 factor (ECF subfamily)